MRVRVAPLPAVALVGLGALNGWLIMIVRGGEEVGVQEPPASVAPSRALSEKESGLSNVKPVHAYVETLAHPVFSKARAPYVPPPPTSLAAPKTDAPPLPVDPGIAVGGVVLDGVLKKAYLFKKGGATGSWVSEGETFVGWKVESIEPGSAKLQQAGRTLELHLYEHR
jgi:hypothetical protein